MDPILNVLKVAMPTPPEINVGARSMRAPGSTTYDRMHGWCGEVNITLSKYQSKAYNPLNHIHGPLKSPSGINVRFTIIS